MPDGINETFFRPAELARERLTLPASLYNQCRLVLSRCGNDHVFVPIPALQIQSVIDREEVIFVDNHAYTVHNGKGGKLIKLAWMFRLDHRGHQLDAPAPIELVYYSDTARELHSRLVSEFKKALDLQEERARSDSNAAPGRKILPFSRD